MDNPTIAGARHAAVLPGPGTERRRQIRSARITRSRSRSRTARSMTNGSLFYPDTRAFFDGFLGPYIPGSDVSPIWNPEFFGNCIVVNGRTWPFLDVEPRRYRFRLLNGCQSRFLILKFDDPKVDVWQIGAEGGFLRAPVKVSEILMGPAERADLIVDFSRVKFGTNVTLLNVGPDAPFAGGGFRRADPRSTGLVMQFRVNQPLVGVDRHDATGTARHAGAAANDRGTRAAAGATRNGVAAESPTPHRDPSRHVRSDGRRSRRDHVHQMGRSGDGEPSPRRHRGLGTLQLHRRRASDPHPRGVFRGAEPAADRQEDGAAHPNAPFRPGRRKTGSRTRSSPIRARSPGPDHVRAGRPVRVALSYRRARGQ